MHIKFTLKELKHIMLKLLHLSDQTAVSEKDLGRKQRTKPRHGYQEIIEFVRIQK